MIKSNTMSVAPAAMLVSVCGSAVAQSESLRR
jgi:hypothetical protein